MLSFRAELLGSWMLAAHSPKTFYGFHEIGRRPGQARTDPIRSDPSAELNSENLVRKIHKT